MTFKELGLNDQLLEGIDAMGFETATPIQEKAIPVILEGRDLIACAQTGTGKTAAFLLPILHQLTNTESDSIDALIMVPTRELAIQIEESIKTYNKYTGLRHTVIFGGVKQGSQVRAIKEGIHILVATPGRLLDLINQGFLSLDDIKIFVLDEADRMLDMGFIHDIKKIVKLLPNGKRHNLHDS